jgi:hypothetical protein
MHSPILPVGGPSGLPIADPDTSVAGDLDDFLAGLDSGARVLSIAAGSVGPPPDVAEQIVAAGAIERRLRAHGRHVRFLPGSDGRISLQIRDDATGAHRTLSLTEACELAAGARLG